MWVAGSMPAEPATRGGRWPRDRGLRRVHGRQATGRRAARSSRRSRRRASRDSFVWIGLHEPSHEEFEAVREEFGLHELAVEDAISRPPAAQARGVRRRPLRGAEDGALRRRGRDGASSPSSSSSSARATSSPCATARPAPWPRCGAPSRTTSSRIRCGPMAVLHAVMDRVVDDYVPVIDGLDNDMAEIEDAVFAVERPRGADDPSQRIFKLKREVLDFYRNTEPLLEPLGRLAAGQLPGAHPELGQLLPRRGGPPQARGERHRPRPRPAVRRPRRQPRPGHRAAERRHAHDLRLARHRRLPDGGGRDLRHELRATCPSSAPASATTPWSSSWP